MTQSKTSAETPAPVKDQTTSPWLGQAGAGAPTPKDSHRKSGGTPAGNLSLPGNGKAEDALPDAAELSHQIAKRSRELVAEFLKRQAAKAGIARANPLAVGPAFREMPARVMSDTSRLTEAQLSVPCDYRAFRH